MEPIDVDEVAEINFSDASEPGEQTLEVIFKDGTKRRFSGAELPDVMAVLNHWTPPTA